MIDREEFNRLAPYARPGEFGWANFADQEGTVDPVVATEALAAKARELSVEVVYPREIKSFRTSGRRVTALETSAGRMETLGYRVMPKGNYPILGPFEKYPNLYVAALHSGMTMAPIIGQFASLEILHGARVDMLAPYRPQRFS